MYAPVIRFKLNVTSRSGPASGYAVLELQPAPPQPSDGSCAAAVEGNASPAVALVHRVTVSCSDWRDHSDAASPLEYHVFVDDSASDDGGRFRWYPLYRGSRTQVTFYPSQARGDYGVVNVYVQVIDSVGNARRALHASVPLSDLLVRSVPHINQSINQSIGLLRNGSQVAKYMLKHKIIIRYIKS